MQHGLRHCHCRLSIVDCLLIIELSLDRVGEGEHSFADNHFTTTSDAYVRHCFWIFFLSHRPHRLESFWRAHPPNSLLAVAVGMVFALTSWIAPSAAWSMLRRHAADDVGALKLVDLKLVKHDDDDYVAVHRSSNTVGDNSSAVRERNSGDGGDDGSHLLIVDWSRQRMTNDTMGHLMSLSVSMEIKEKILDLAWGKLAPHSKLQSKLPQGDRGTFDQHLLPYNRQHDNGGKPKTTFDGFGRRKPWTPDCIDDQFGNDNDSNDSNDDDEMGFEVTFNEQLALHNNTQEQRSIDKQNVTKLNSATRKYFEDQRRYDIVESNIRNNDDHDNDAIVDTNTTSENNGNKSGGSMHLAYRAPANKGLFMRYA